MLKYVWPFFSINTLPAVTNTIIGSRKNAYRSAISKIRRVAYVKRYPVKVLKPDGSTIEIRAPEPRYLIQLPVDLNSLSESERRQRLALRKKKVIQVKEEEIDDAFNVDDYADIWKKASGKDSSVDVTMQKISRQ